MTTVTTSSVGSPVIYTGGSGGSGATGSSIQNAYQNARVQNQMTNAMNAYAQQTLTNKPFRPQMETQLKMALGDGVMKNLGNTMLEPIMIHGTQLMRVPVAVMKDDIDGSAHYTVFINGGMKRMYTNETLPDPIKAKLALINTSKEAGEQFEDIPEESFKIQCDLYIKEHPKNFDDVGWRVSKHYYCVVMPMIDMAQLGTSKA